MHSAILWLHSWLRYPVLLTGIALLWLAISASRSSRSSPSLNRLHMAFLGLLDTQMLLGLVLYFALSPLSAAAFADMAAAMKDPTLRFFGLEHASTMLIAITVAHVGRVRAKRAAGDARLRIVIRAQAAWLLLTLIAIPWPALDIGRPLFRM